MNLLPFSVFEILVPILIIILIYMLIKKRKYIITYLLSLFLIFTLTTGMLYQRTPIYETTSYTYEQLAALADYLTVQINSLEAEEMTRDEILEYTSEAMQTIEEGYYPSCKKMISSSLMSYQQITGIFSPFTIEANINIDIPTYNLPFTCCHELSHLLGYMSEQEANYIAYMACIQSDIVYFQYSGYLTAYSYAINRLSDDYVIEINDQAKADLIENNQYWSQYDGTLSSIQSSLNDAYLKFNGDSGTVSYSQFLNYLIQYYQF